MTCNLGEHPVTAVCASRELQFAITLEMLAASRDRCSGGGFKAWARQWNTGSCGLGAGSDAYAENASGVFETLRARAGISLTQSWSAGESRWIADWESEAP